MLFIDRLLNSFDEYGVSYSLVGGYAVALHGAPRGTVDIDCIIPHQLSQFVAIEKALFAIGLKPRIALDAKELFASRLELVKDKSLYAWSFVNPNNPIECVDVIISHDLNALQSVNLKYGQRDIKVVCIEHLIAMKKHSARPQDLEDIRALEVLRARKS